MQATQPLKFPKNKIGNLLLYFFLASTSVVFSQTTFTESAAAYNLNLGGGKDGGHAWSDFDGDGDIDVLINRNSTSQRNYLMRNNGDGTFTNVQATLAPGMIAGDRAERQAAWGDVNGDGRPDFMMTSFGTNSNTVAIQLFIQNADGTFGNGIGSTVPLTVGENNNETITINPLNVEGAGFFDFEGDGDLDIFFDNHNFGIELLRNNYIDHTTHTVVNPAPNALFTHITPGNGAGVVEFGLNQFATDGDYGSAADVNDDGWVDIFMRKRNENDFFLNQGGTFTNGSDLAQAANGNKGGNGLWDLDNDGDLDAVWTENGLNQIFRNDGPGIWTALGAATFPGLPQPGNTDNGSSSNDIDALAGGDIDNDGDIDILFVGDNRSYLFINQLNSPTPAPGVIGSGAAMSFTLDPETFNNRNGEGTTMIDIDDDGDLDIYMNINNNSNQLFINNLPAANRNNHLLIDVTEDRGADGSTGGIPERVAIGTNVIIKDCEGNIISGLRQVNGVYGHGTQSPEEVHFGLPLGENETYIIEVRYPNFYDASDPSGFSRLIATIVATPSTIPGTNHYDLSTTDAEIVENINPPDAVDDLEVVPFGNTVSVQINLFDNDTEPDGEDFFIDNIVQPAIGTVVIDDADLGLVTYTYSAAVPFPGTTFEYTITDSTVSICPALGKSDTATVTIYEMCADASGLDSDGDGINDVCDLDDDNDGILDTEEGLVDTNLMINSSFEVADGTTDANPAVSGGNATITLSGWNIIGDIDIGEATVFGNPAAVAFASGDQLLDLLGNNPTEVGNPPAGADLSTLPGYVPNGIEQIVTTVSGITYAFSFDFTGHVAAGQAAELFINGVLIDEVIYKNTSAFVSNTYGITFTGTGSDTIQLIASRTGGNNGGLLVDNFKIAPISALGADQDTDTIFNHLDSDSDNDGCNDADEAYADTNADSDNNGFYGAGTPAIHTDGTVVAASYQTPADANGNGTYDFLEAGAAPSATAQPADQSVFDCNQATFTSSWSNATAFQWQESTDGGATFTDIVDDGVRYVGAGTANLAIINAGLADNGNQYRVLVTNAAFICDPNTTSNIVNLLVSAKTVITNRRITYRVNKN